MRVALLARVSTEGQADADRHSLPAQLSAMRARCEREGWSIVREYIAPGESAYTDDLERRPVLAEAVRGAEAGEFDLLLVHESSRFARKVKLHHEIEARLARAGVQWLEAGEPLAPRTASKFMVDGVKALLNEHWSMQMSEHIRKGYTHRFELGLPTGDVPFGYESRGVDQAPAVVADEALAIRRVFRARAGGAGYAELARVLNAGDYRPHSKVGNTSFTASAVQSLLENEFYFGVVVHRGERRPGAHEAIITEDEYLAAAAVVNRMRAARARNPRLLSGLAECVVCAAPLNVSQSGRKGAPLEYYRESQRGACGSRRWRADELEAKVDELVSTMAADQAWIEGIERRARKLPAKRDTGEREKLLEERRRATKAWISGDLDEREYRELKDAIDARVARVPAALPGGVLFSGKRFKTFADVWAVLSVERKREALRLMWERVYVDVEGRDVWFRPAAEFEAVFADRRRWVRGTPDRTGGFVVPSNPRPWLYWAGEMTA